MSRIKYNENELLENPTNFYKEFNKFSERIYHCGNDKLQIECNISNMSNELIEYIKKLHLTDYNKSLELIDVNNKQVNSYAFKSIQECSNCEQKDARIAELEEENNEFCSYNKKIREENTNLSPQEVEQLKQENEKLKQAINKKFLNMKYNDFIKLCISCGVGIEVKDKDNQTVKEFAYKLKSILLDYGTIEQANIVSIIDNLLKERGIE